MEYIIEFERREQYDCNCNSKPRAFAKSFDETATLKDVVDWVAESAGCWFDDYNLLTNPQILGIRKEKKNAN